MSPGTILIRADAGLEIGTGHVMRCLALAQASQDAGGAALFALATCPHSLRARLSDEGFEQVSISAPIGSREDALQTLELAQSREANWVVLDGYSLGSEYQRVIRTGTAKLAHIDDMGESEHLQGHVIVNQNLHASESMYSRRDSGTRLLLGPKFALIRREFNNPLTSTRAVPLLAKRLLVSMGGTDPANMSLRVLDGLQSLSMPDLDIQVAVTSSNPRIPALKTACERVQGAQLVIDPNMPELVAWADVAVVAAGLICWEMCAMGLPALLIDVARNQTPIAKSLSRDGISWYLGNSRDLTAQAIATGLERLVRSAQECRLAMSQRARQIVDGKGANRVVAEVQRI